MLVPKRAKYRKQQRGVQKGVAYRGTRISFGEFGLLSQGTAWISSRQIEAARRAITHSIQRGGRVWIRIFPDKPITKKPAETRMGGGKGDVTECVAPVRPGRMLFEMGGVSREAAHEALRLASHKLPVKTLIMDKNHIYEIKRKKEIFSKTIDELKKLLKETRDELFNIKLEFSQNKLKNQKSYFGKERKSL